MDALKGKTILIGKEPVQGRLLISIVIDGQCQNATIGNINSVPNCVSRCIPSEGVAHCKITIEANGSMIITNMKPHNTTYVNGNEIISKNIYPNSQITLGVDKYPINIDKILDAAEKLVNKNEFSINPLEKIWNTYDNDLYNLQKKQKRLALLNRLYMPCTFLSGAIGGAAQLINSEKTSESTKQIIASIGINSEVINVISGIMFAIAAIILFYGLYKSLSDRSIEERRLIAETFQSQYICPNPKCHRFLGNIPYNILRQNTNCPHCKCKFTEK